ncbi:MAG: hypothetical protein QM727_10945 [Niabella sp.]
MIRIRTFKAPEDHEACEKFLVGHRKLLEIFGITQITSNRQDWMDDPDTIVILVEDSESKRVYGGARLQMATGKYPLPIETALGKFDTKIYDMVAKDKEAFGTCELCGLWNSREIAGMGVGSYILSRVGATIASQLPVRSIFVLCAPITVRMGKRVGAVVETELGDNGLFYYPKEDLVATPLRLRDIYDLGHADPNEREKILSLREQNHQFIEEKGPKATNTIEYDLKIPNL